MTNIKFFTAPLRRQLLHRPLPALARVRPVRGRADRVELRPEVKHENPFLVHGRQRNDGRRRAVDHQRRLLEHVVPGVPGGDRAAQLPRQLHRLPAAGQDGRQLPPRRRRSWSRSTARSGRASACSARPASRSRASVAARQQVRPPADAGTSCAAASPPRTGTTLVTMALYLLARWIFSFGLTAARPGRRRTSTARSARRRSRWPASLVLAASRSSTSSWSSAPSHGVPAPAARSTARSTTRTSGGTSASGSCAGQPSAVFNGTPFKNRHLAAAGGPDRQARLRRRLRHHRRRPWSPSGTTARSTRAASSSATRRRTAPSSPTASRSAPAAPSASARWSTTA